MGLGTGAKDGCDVKKGEREDSQRFLNIGDGKGDGGAKSADLTSTVRKGNREGGREVTKGTLGGSKYIGIEGSGGSWPEDDLTFILEGYGPGRIECVSLKRRNSMGKQDNGKGAAR